MNLHPVNPLNTVTSKERLLHHANRQQSRNRQRSVLMRAIQKITPDQV